MVVVYVVVVIGGWCECFVQVEIFDVFVCEFEGEVCEC